LPVERKSKIKELIQVRNTMKISELSKAIGVSEMTIHRDIKPLIEEGIIIKTFGGISRIPKENNIDTEGNRCEFCNGQLSNQMVYRIILTDGSMVTTCCAHCGLLKYNQLEGKVTHALCRDLILQTTISAHHAWYVLDTSIHVGCCEPQVLTFEKKEHAEKFVKGFGGNMYGFVEAKTMIHEKMNSCHHS